MRPALKLSPEALQSLGSMEGAYDRPFVEKIGPQPVVKPAEKVAPWRGWTAAMAVTLVAYAIHYLPFAPFRVAGEGGVRRPVSAAILAMFLGAIVDTIIPLSKTVLEGAKHAARRTIPITIVLTGASLSFANARAAGVRACVIITATMTVAMAAAWVCGKMLGVWPRTRVLIGAGTAICGNSAIIAVAPLIDAEDRDIMLSVGAINVVSLALMFVSPLAGAALGLTDEAYGVWAGSTLHAVPQAVAAGFAFSQKAGGLATLVKLVRVALLAPLLVVLAFAYARSRKDRIAVHYGRLVPPFLWGFFVLFLLNSFGFLPALAFQNGYRVASADVLEQAGSMLLTLAMAAMGLELNLRMLARVGGTALVAAAAASMIACAASWALIRGLL